ncbi:MAG: hypothetical protein M3R52_00780 [Acidobacteriota bacterium]|nr:hypothetical protein [Acidobacteriota bacterium]
MRFAGIERPLIRSTQLLLLFVTLYVPVLSGQESRVQEQTAPPPLKIISRLERSQLNESKDAKDRVRTTLELALVHLAEAEAQTSQHDYPAAAAGAGRYWALVEDVFTFLKTMKSDSNKTRDLYKRVELALRAHGPRLSAIRRGTPAEYSVWIKTIEDFARDGRTEALNSFYGHTVFRDKPPEQQQANKPLQKSSITPDKNQP